MASEPAGHHPRSLDDVTISLTEAERDAISDEFSDRAGAHLTLPMDDEDLLTDAEISASLFPARVLRALHRFRRHGSAAGALLIRNVPVDTELPPTPEDGYVGHWSTIPVATFAQLALTSVLGDVIAYADEKEGNLVQDVAPVKGAEDRQENSGSAYLELHTENGFHPHKPDFITLLCLRPDRGGTGRTVVGTASQILDRLSEQCIAVLRRPLFRLRVASSFGDGPTHLLTEPMPVLSGTVAAPEFLADFHATRPVDEVAQAAFDELREALLPSLRGGLLDRGDLLVVDNRTAVHGRQPFAARYDGQDRWLRRCFGVSDLRRSQGVRFPGSRVCSPLTTIGLSPHPVGPAGAGPCSAK